jgi:hypothetical protein
MNLVSQIHSCLTRLPRALLDMATAWTSAAPRTHYRKRPSSSTAPSSSPAQAERCHVLHRRQEPP